MRRCVERIVRPPSESPSVLDCASKSILLRQQDRSYAPIGLGDDPNAVVLGIGCRRPGALLWRLLVHERQPADGLYPEAIEHGIVVGLRVLGGAITPVAGNVPADQN